MVSFHYFRIIVGVVTSIVARKGGRGATAPTLAQRKKEKRGKNTLSVHLHGLLAVAQVSNGF